MEWYRRQDDDELRIRTENKIIWIGFNYYNNYRIETVSVFFFKY